MHTCSSDDRGDEMIRTLIGDLFTSEAHTLVNTVNCVGVMGKGVALEFKTRYPEMYKDYVARCNAGQVRLGEPYLFRGLFPPWILNFPTKDHWRSVSRLSDIVDGLVYLKKHYKDWGIESLAVPPLGCGQGQLEWRVVGPTLWRYLNQLDIPVELYAPAGTPVSQLEDGFLAGVDVSKVPGGYVAPPASKINPAWVALLEIVARIEREPYHWPVGRTTFQKIAYFATESGIPTGLHFQKASYGPFASELKQVTTQLANNGLIEERHIGNMFSVAAGPTHQDALDAFRSEVTSWEPAIERITDLFLRMRTLDAEVAATVHYAAKSLTLESPDKPTECDVLHAVKAWKQRRRPPLTDGEVASAIRHLNILGWIDVRPSVDLPVPEGENLFG
jgi:O-acetyl-ADP-ribose deacetylase (regulator of RNase III)/uncharacterized protein YwgA